MQPDDIANLIAPLHAASWKSAYRGIMPDHFLDYVVDGERLSHWRRRVRELQAGGGEIYLARVNDEPVGFLCIEGAPLNESFANAAYVNNLHVLPHIKGQGIGTALLAEGAKWAKAHGFSEMTLFVFEDNLAARAFYKSNGWHAVARLMSELPIAAEGADSRLAAELRLVKAI
jgi:ribosomal protein S18 acetylase RimI-like enzyme